MTEEEITKGNILIAEFLGEHNISTKPFHSSWDAIMPVIDKIDSIGYDVEMYKNLNRELYVCRVLTGIGDDRIFSEDKIISETAELRIEAAYKAVVRFIEEKKEFLLSITAADGNNKK